MPKKSDCSSYSTDDTGLLGILFRVVQLCSGHLPPRNLLFQLQSTLCSKYPINPITSVKNLQSLTKFVTQKTILKMHIHNMNRDREYSFCLNQT